jgi:pilus assembly protein CpaC
LAGAAQRSAAGAQEINEGSEAGMTSGRELKRAIGAGVCAAALAISASGSALAAEPVDLMSNSAPPAHAAAENLSEVGVAINKSRIITTHRQFGEVSVGNEEIADVVPLSRNRFYILGKSIGSTNVVLTDSSGRVIDVIDVLVSYDIDSLKRKIHEIAPDESVEVRAANNTIILSGTVGDSGAAGKLAALAERYAPGQVTNMIGVAGSQQVMLQVRFAEVQRSALKDIGNQLQFQDLDGSGFFPQLGLPGEFGGKTLGGLNNLNYFAAGGTLVKAGDYALTAVFDALEERGLVRTLAEPNIISLSGDTASFLAGGEFPIPVAQSRNADNGSTITIEFKEFGVGLSFTPTVIGKEAINLELATEVSSIDPTVSVKLENIIVPGLRVRRTNTTVELLDGQSFAIAGLIEDSLEESVRAIPGLSSLPIIGALARSEDFKRRQTELVVLITARLVQPVSGKRLALPTDYITPPREFDFFLLGKLENLNVAGKSGGVDGKYGYQQP